MRLALTDLFRARWTDRVHDEWISALLKNRPDLKAEQLQVTRNLMNSNVRDCLITDYEDLIETLALPDPDDRHVLAAAIRGRCDLIVTMNMKDFPPEALDRYGIEAQHPDDFIYYLMDLVPEAVIGTAKTHRAALKKPIKTAESYLSTLESLGMVQTVTELRKYSDVI